MTDNKLRCAILYRLSAEEPYCVVLAQLDHAKQYDTHNTTRSTEPQYYGGHEQPFAKAVGTLIHDDPPLALTETDVIGGFKVVQSNQHQVCYGADGDGICKFEIPYLSHNKGDVIALTSFSHF